MKGEGGDIQPALPGSLTGKERKRKGLAQGECWVLGLGACLTDPGPRVGVQIKGQGQTGEDASCVTLGSQGEWEM